MQQTTIQSFPNFILRNPAFPIHVYLDLLENYSEEKLLKLYQNDYIKEAIQIASPDLVASLERWPQQPTEKKEAIALAFLKYVARICSRCTPFGLFAGCSVGSISDYSNIVLKPTKQFTRLTQFDMHFWIALLQGFSKRKDVIPHLLFYPNNSIYVQGDFFRYIEYKFVKTSRTHNISAIAQTDLLFDLLEKAQDGITVSQMTALLADDESEEEEALAYINQLIDFQLLVSELDAQVTGNAEWERVLQILSKIPTLKNERQWLLHCKEQLDLLDRQIVPEANQYAEIKKSIAQMDCPYEEKFLFQTDLNTTTERNSLNRKVVEKTQQALHFLNGIQKKQPIPNLTNFAKAFFDRYETREMPLATVLDTEIGIGYLQNIAQNDSHPLLENFSLNKKSPPSETENWSANSRIMEIKLQQAMANGDAQIELSENDFPNFDSHWENGPATFSVMLEVILKNGAEQIVLESTGGISAAKLLGRFCNINPEIHSVTQTIIQKETDDSSGKILAEIAHIPQSRTGNILRRPVLREFEIPYLANSGVSREFQIPVADLMVSVKNNAVVLRSKSRNKEIVPCLSNAHNFSSNALPIYQFLADMQAQHLKPVFNFDWGILQQHYDFFPRVVYKDVILCKAKWMIADNEIAALQKLSGPELFTQFALWKKQKKLPRFVNWVYADHTLLLDFEQEIGVTLFLKSVKNYTKIILEEFLFDSDALVKNTHGDGFTNQIILSFFKTQQP